VATTRSNGFEVQIDVLNDGQTHLIDPTGWRPWSAATITARRRRRRRPAGKSCAGLLVGFSDDRSVGRRCDLRQSISSLEVRDAPKLVTQLRHCTRSLSSKAVPSSSAAHRPRSSRTRARHLRPERRHGQMARQVVDIEDHLVQTLVAVDRHRAHPFARMLARSIGSFGSWKRRAIGRLVMTARSRF
jgi:hypothetical protein